MGLLTKMGIPTIGGLIFEKGGKVPGPKGKAQLAIVHGGEKIIPAKNSKKEEPMRTSAIPEPYREPKDGSEKDYEACRAVDDIMRVHVYFLDAGLMKRVRKLAGTRKDALDVIEQYSPKSNKDMMAEMLGK